MFKSTFPFYTGVVKRVKKIHGSKGLETALLFHGLTFFPVKSFDLISDAFHKFQCGLCNGSYYSEIMRQLDITSGEDIGVTSYRKTVKPSNSSPAFSSFAPL